MALPPGLDLSAYRILQEGLTNALKHARASRRRCRCATDPRAGARGPRRRLGGDGASGTTTALGGLGHGLVGIRERVKIYGGQMSAGASRAGGYVLRARFPLDGVGP